jgi:hypothetical protein
MDSTDSGTPSSKERIGAKEAARARGDTALDGKVLDDLSERYDTALRSGITYNRLDATRAAIEGKPWLPPLPTIS